MSFGETPTRVSSPRDLSTAPSALRPPISLSPCPRSPRSPQREHESRPELARHHLQLLPLLSLSVASSADAVGPAESLLMLTHALAHLRFMFTSLPPYSRSPRRKPLLPPRLQQTRQPSLPRSRRRQRIRWVDRPSSPRSSSDPSCRSLHSCKRLRGIKTAPKQVTDPIALRHVLSGTRRARRSRCPSSVSSGRVRLQSCDRP